MSAPALAAALLAIQKDAPTLEKDLTGQVQSRKYQYAGLDQVMNKLRPLLNEHGLLLTQECYWAEDGTPALLTTLEHAETGEHRRYFCPLLGDLKGMQALGSAITYARRYSLYALFGLSGEDDDDGARAGGRKPKPEPEPEPEAETGEPPAHTVEQIEALAGLLADLENADAEINWNLKLKTWMQTHLNKTDSGNLNVVEYETLLDYARKLLLEATTPELD